jgi:hypothetical protein
MTDEEHMDQMRDEFLRERPDLAHGFITLASGEKVVDVKVVPEFALWAVGRGYAGPEAFGLSLEIRDKVNAHFDAKGL